MPTAAPSVRRRTRARIQSCVRRGLRTLPLSICVPGNPDFRRRVGCRTDAERTPREAPHWFGSIWDGAMRDFKSQTSAHYRPGLQWLRILQRVLQDNVQSAVGWETLTQSALPSIDEVGPAGCCVLVVDDEPVNLILASAMLSSFGVKAMVAENGAEAVSLACAVRLDAILMDLQMPVLDGLAATRQIRRVEREHCRARVPVVAYTTAAPALHLCPICRRGHPEGNERRRTDRIIVRGG